MFIIAEILSRSAVIPSSETTGPKYFTLDLKILEILFIVTLA